MSSLSKALYTPIGEKVMGIFLATLIALAYFYITMWGRGSILDLSAYPYYNYLTEAFFQGRLNVYPPESMTMDLSDFEGKWYLYWGLSPVLFIIPFYLIWGANAPDVLYTLVAGLLNVLIFYLILLEVIKLLKIAITPQAKFLTVIAYALISPNFWNSSHGLVWQSHQIFGTFYLSISLLFYFKYLNSKTKLLHLNLSIIFFYLAILSRNILFPYVLLYLFLFKDYFISKNYLLLKQTFLIFVVISAVFFTLMGIYNFLRFGNPLENGMKYQNLTVTRYRQIVGNAQIFSLSHIPTNIYYYFLHHINYHPAKILIKDSEGNSIFSSYPISFLFLAVLYKFFAKKFKPSYQIFLSRSFAVIVISFTLLMLYFYHGGPQFGLRYILDVAPLLYLTLIFVLDDIANFIKVPLFIAGIYMGFVASLIQ